MDKASVCNAGDTGDAGLIPGQEDPWSRAWKTPWTEEPGGLQSIGSQRVRYNSYVCV